MTSPNKRFVSKDDKGNPQITVALFWPFACVVTNNGRKEDESLSHEEQSASFLADASMESKIMTTKAEQENIAHAHQYICTDDRVGRKVYDYYNEALGDDQEREFEEHLWICFRCQDILLKLDSIFDVIRINREEWLGPEERFENKVSVETDGET